MCSEVSRSAACVYVCVRACVSANNDPRLNLLSRTLTCDSVPLFTLEHLALTEGCECVWNVFKLNGPSLKDRVRRARRGLRRKDHHRGNLWGGGRKRPGSPFCQLGSAALPLDCLHTQTHTHMVPPEDQIKVWANVSRTIPQCVFVQPWLIVFVCCLSWDGEDTGGVWACVCVHIQKEKTRAGTRKGNRGRSVQRQMSECVFVMWGHAGNLIMMSVCWYKCDLFSLCTSAWPCPHYTLRCTCCGPWSNTHIKKNTCSLPFCMN